MTVTLTIERITRSLNTPSGNPRYVLTGQDPAVPGHRLQYRTSNDAQCAYDVMPGAWEGRTFALHLDTDQRIVGFTEVYPKADLVAVP